LFEAGRSPKKTKPEHASVSGKKLPNITCAGVAVATLTFKVSFERPAVFGLLDLLDYPPDGVGHPAG
jgi:hypothetical protein